MSLLDRIAAGRSTTTQATPGDAANHVVLPGTVLARLAAHVDATRTGSWEVQPIEQLADLRDFRVRVGRELVQVAGAGSIAHVRPKVQERQFHRLTFATRTNWRHRSGQPILVASQVVGRLEELVEPTNHQMRTTLTEPERVRVGTVVQIAGELAEVERIDVMTSSEEVPGRGESVLKPALLVSRRGLDGPSVEHFPQEPISYAPHHAVVVAGPGVEHVEIGAEDNAHGRLLLRTDAEPQRGQLLQLHFGEPVNGLPLPLLVGEADETGESLELYGLAPGLTGAGFAIRVGTAPRPTTTYRLRYALVRD